MLSLSLSLSLSEILIHECKYTKTNNKFHYIYSTHILICTKIVLKYGNDEQHVKREIRMMSALYTLITYTGQQLMS